MILFERFDKQLQDAVGPERLVAIVDYAGGVFRTAPLSQQYKAGFIFAIVNHIAKNNLRISVDSQSPYSPGTVEADAFRFGFTRGQQQYEKMPIYALRNIVRPEVSHG